MKITCQSCQSKYNVADDKVEGKIVKIRCRKCGATIVVNGAGGAGTNGSGAAEITHQQGAVGGDGAQWHVNVSDSDQRTLTLAELVDAYNSGVVTQDTFIWCDGMEDWRPLAEVDVVVTALHASANQLSAGATGPIDVLGGGAYEPPSGGGYDPPPPESSPAAYEAPAVFAGTAASEPKRAAVAKREARARDLFATNAGEDLHTSAPAVPHSTAPLGDASSLTGQRNENSVLFSLAVLTQNSDERPAQNAPMANKEDSGLIDLKALAQKAQSMRPMAMGNGDVFQAPLGMTPPLGAPVGAYNSSIGPEAKPKSRLPLLIGGGAGVLVLMVLCIVIGVKIAGGSPAPVPTAAAVPTVTATAEPAATAPPATADSAASAAAASASVAAATGKKPPTATAVGAWHPPGVAATKPPSGSGGATPTPTPTPPPTPKRGGGDCGCNGDLMCLMKCSTH